MRVPEKILTKFTQILEDFRGTKEHTEEVNQALLQSQVLKFPHYGPVLLGKVVSENMNHV